MLGLYTLDPLTIIRLAGTPCNRCIGPVHCARNGAARNCAAASANTGSSQRDRQPQRPAHRHQGAVHPKRWHTTAGTLDPRDKFAMLCI